MIKMAGATFKRFFQVLFRYASPKIYKIAVVAITNKPIFSEVFQPAVKFVGGHLLWFKPGW